MNCPYWVLDQAFSQCVQDFILGAFSSYQDKGRRMKIQGRFEAVISPRIIHDHRGIGKPNPPFAAKEARREGFKEADESSPVQGSRVLKDKSLKASLFEVLIF
jgi:hypothetical protein